MNPRILVVSGLPASGKSTVAARLKRELAWPLIAKDDIKEQLFDALGAGDGSWSRRLSITSYGVLFSVARQLTDANMPFILEGNFRWEQTHAGFAALNARFTQIWCTADEATLLERLTARAQQGSRHAGHRDEDLLPMLAEQMRREVPAPLPLPGELITVDTSVDRSGLDAELGRLIGRLKSR